MAPFEAASTSEAPTAGPIRLRNNSFDTTGPGMISRIRSATGDLNPASLALSSSSVLPSISATPSWAAAPVVSEITTQPEAAATLATRMPPDRISEIASKLTGTLLSPFSYNDNAPASPVEPPAAWTLLAFASREVGGTFSKKVPSDNPITGAITNSLLADTPTLDADLGTALPSQSLLSAVTADTQGLYTGQPSIVERVVVAGLRVVNAALGLFGFQSVLPFASLQIPIFTDGKPPFFVTAGLNVQRSEFEGMPVYTLQRPGSTSEEVIVALHGGGYVGQISIFHWMTYARIARDTGATVVVPVYPVAPQGTAAVVVPATADLLSDLIDKRGSENVSVLGDSAGGGLALAAVQELVRRGDPTPSRLVLLAPWLDATVSDPASQTIRDPLLDVPTLRKDGLLWAGGLDPSDPLVSPINGSLEGLPPTYVYSGSLDLLSPGTLRLRERALAEGRTNFTFILRKDEIHDWPTFPFLPEAHRDLPAIERQLLGTDV